MNSPTLKKILKVPHTPRGHTVMNESGKRSSTATTSTMEGGKAAASDFGATSNKQPLSGWVNNTRKGLVLCSCQRILACFETRNVPAVWPWHVFPHRQRVSRRTSQSCLGVDREWIFKFYPVVKVTNKSLN